MAEGLQVVIVSGVPFDHALTARQQAIAKAMAARAEVYYLYVRSHRQELAALRVAPKGNWLSAALFGRVEMMPSGVTVIHVPLLRWQGPWGDLDTWRARVSDPLFGRTVGFHVRRLLPSDGGSRVLLVMASPPYTAVVGHCGESHVVYDRLDDWPHFREDGDGEFAERTLARERRVVMKASLVTASAAPLLSPFQNCKVKKTVVPNGTGLDPEQIPVQGSRPKDLPHSGPLIGCVGSWNYWCNTALIEATLAKIPEAHFVFVGSLRETREASLLKCLPRTVLVGPKPLTQLVDYIRCFDVCVIPFHLSELTRGVDPCKLYDYFALGKPVVSVPLPAVLEHGDAVYIAQDPVAFGDAVQRALRESDPFDKLRSKRLAIARARHWKVLGNHMCDLLETIVKSQSARGPDA